MMAGFLQGQDCVRTDVPVPPVTKIFMCILNLIKACPPFRRFRTAGNVEAGFPIATGR